MKYKGQYKICLACGCSYYVEPYRSESKYCSEKCSNHLRYKKIEVICKSCGKVSSVSESKKSRKYCDIFCKLDWLKKHKTEREARKAAKKALVSKRGRNHSRNLRNFVFSKKCPRCEVCGYDEYLFCLDIHHLDKNVDNSHIDNLKILCVICHKKLHAGINIFRGDKNKKEIEELKTIQPSLNLCRFNWTATNFDTKEVGY